ncbi:hypothetical protein EVAR_13475_1 [Eumeta japonica]|uniref:Uncharacterized protein n=1 Tax=Eumeta variegata TaxID=151549 RepID=A0A4C1UZA8_EUMVA|nr:hypothetical protein EVAR_13475_1 [Eumeta japonica]
MIRATNGEYSNFRKHMRVYETCDTCRRSIHAARRRRSRPPAAQLINPREAALAPLSRPLSRARYTHGNTC